MKETKKPVREEVTETSLVVVATWSATTPVVVGSSPGGIVFFFEKKFFFKFFFQKKIFPGVFEWFRLHKKVSLTTLGPSGRSGMASTGPQVACKTAFLANFGQFRVIWCKK